MTPVARNCGVWAVRWVQALPPQTKLRFGLKKLPARNFDILRRSLTDAAKRKVVKVVCQKAASPAHESFDRLQFAAYNIV